MRYFATASSPQTREATRAGLFGLIATPAGGTPPWAGVARCADNACYANHYPGDDRYLTWLRRHAAHAATCGRDSDDPAVRASVKGVNAAGPATRQRIRATRRKALNDAIADELIAINRPCTSRPLAGVPGPGCGPTSGSPNGASPASDPDR